MYTIFYEKGKKLSKMMDVYYLGKVIR